MRLKRALGIGALIVAALAVAGIASADAQQSQAGSRGLPGLPAPSIWAVLNPKPGGTFEVQNGRHTTGATYNEQHIITVSFDRDVSDCAYLVTPRSEPALLNHTVAARPVPDFPKKIEVELTEGRTGNWHVLPFQVLVVC